MYCDAKEIRFRNREELTLKSKVKTFLIDILLDIVGGCFIAIGVYNFAVASGFPVAGISGIAIVFYYFWKIPIGTMTTILNIPIILICYKLLGKQFFLRSIKTMLISNILMDWVVPLFPVYQGDMMLYLYECILRNRICINLHERYLYRWSRFCFDGNTQGKATYFCRKNYHCYGFYYCNYWWNSDAWKH